MALCGSWWATRVRVTMPLKQAGAEVGGTRSHWYCSWFCSGSPAVKSKPHFLLRTSFWAASWRSMKFFDSCLSTGPNRSRFTRAREILFVIGFRTTAGDRSLAISDNATGLHTLALIVLLTSLNSLPVVLRYPTKLCLCVARPLPKVKLESCYCL